MKRIIFPLLTLVLVPWSSADAQPPAQRPDLRAAIAAGAPFRAQLNPGENNGTLVGGEVYEGSYDPRSQTFTVSGPGNADGNIIPVTATYGGSDPLANQINLFGAGYRFDERGNLFLGYTGRLAGRLFLIRR